MWEFKSRSMEAAKEAVEIIPGKKEGCRGWGRYREM